MGVTKEQLALLRNTIPPIEWRVQSFNKKYNEYSKPEGLCVSFTSVEAYQELLDSILGSGNWQVKPLSVPSSEGLLLFCELSINIGGFGWVSKSDVGAAGSDKKEPGILGKTLYSDALKRAAYLWGLGRIHKFLPKLKVDADKFQGDSGSRPSVVNKAGKRVYDISEHVNTLYKKEIQAAIKNFMSVKLDALISEEKVAESIQPVDESSLIINMEEIVKDLSKDEALMLQENITLCEQLFKDHSPWNWEWVDKYRVSKLGHNKSSGIETINMADWDKIIQAIQAPPPKKKEK